MRVGSGVLLSASVGLFFVSLVLFSHPVHAAPDPVSVTITVTVMEEGAPGFNANITGCSATPDYVATGTPTSVSLTPSCSYTINTIPLGGYSGNGTQRELLTNDYVDSVSETSCATGPCASISMAAHVERLLDIGVNCNTPNVSVSSPSSDDWYDYGTTLQVTCNGVFGRSDGTGSRATSWHWDSAASTAVDTASTFTTSPVSMAATHKLSVAVVTQYQLTFNPGAAQALAKVTAPTLHDDDYWYDSGTSVTYTGFGVFGRLDGAGNRSVSWHVGSGSTTTLTTEANFTVPVTMTSPQEVYVTTVKQYEVTLNSAATPYLVSITAPTIKGDNYWYDSGTAVTVTLDGIGPRSDGAGTRLAYYTLNGGAEVPVATKGTVSILDAVSISGKEFIVVSVTSQYQVTLSANAAQALVSMTPTPIPGDDYWYDSGTQVTYTGSGVFSRSGGTGDRVSSWSWNSNASTSVLTTGNFSASATLIAPATLNVQIKKQVEVKLTGEYGVSSATSPTIPGDDYWYDSGTIVSLSLQITFGRSAGTGWRTVSYVLNSGALQSVSGSTTPVEVLDDLNVTSPQTISVQSVQQYEVSFDHGIASSLDSITLPTLSGDDYWYDAGSPVTLTVYGAWGRVSGSGYRLSSYSINGGAKVSVDTTGPVTVLDLPSLSGPQSITSNVTAQYFLAVTGGGGSTYSVSPSIQGDTGWYDAGTAVTVSTDAIYYVQGSTRQRVASWSLDGGPATTVGDVTTVTTSPIVMDAPHDVAFNSVTQYLVSMIVKDSSGARAITPEGITIDVDGGTQSATAGELWADDGASVSVVSILWEGADVTPAQTGTYTVSAPFTIVLNARVYQATVVVKDILGISVSGASVRLLLANQTTVHGTTGGNGSVDFGLVPIGTYQATVSVLGLSTSASGNAAVQNPVTVTVDLSLSVTIVIVVLVAGATTSVLLVRRWRRGPAFRT